MIFKYNKNSNEIMSSINADITSRKKYVKAGQVISGELKDNKINLQIDDTYGKNSGFMTKIFSGTINNTEEGCEIKGRFRLKTFVLILLAILFCFACENLIFSLVVAGLSQDLIFPAIIIVAEIGYFLYMHKTPFENDKLIANYLKGLE